MLGVCSFKVFVKDLSVYYVGSMELQGARERFVCTLCLEQKVSELKLFAKDSSVCCAV